MYEKLKYRIHDIMEPDDTSPAAEQVFVLFMALIVLNVAAVIIETVGSVAARFGGFFYVFNIFSIVIFTIEYLLRLWM